MSIPSVTGLTYDDVFGVPEDGEFCQETGLRAESCGHCQQSDIDRAAFERELEQTVPVAERHTLRAMLDRLQATQDELKGAALAARFDRGNK